MEDDLQIDNDEDLYRNPVYYEPAGRNLDLQADDLGVPNGQGLLNVLIRMRKRVPVDKRGLICPDCRDLRGRRVPMYLVERDGVWFASHYRRPGDKPISHESDEHLARKERVAKDSEDHGFPADIEAQTPDGHARLDVRITGANGIVLGYEPQLSAQTARGMRTRERFRRNGGIRSVWDFADPDHSCIGRVPYLRTPDLPASVIRVQKNPIEIREGNFVVEEGHCTPSGALDRCPNKLYDPENPTATGYCGDWHRVLVPAHQSSSYAVNRGSLTLTQFIVEAAAGERVPFQRDGHYGWLPVQQWQNYLEANGPDPEEKKRLLPSVRRGDRHDRCTEDRPASEVRSEPKQRRGSRSIVLESRPAEAEEARVPVDAAGNPIPLCRFCGDPASLPGPEGLPEHFSCRRKQEP
ncbi:hypothetical protein AMK23_35570 [Streptomyces sp. CB02130]|uniref:hypothetical protein n=1 Tax=Streptomyces sp. CB02130 TaxID=1703934 RepID=UPI0009405D91|nr:hypothetical protein [Streptomyces sp. CB02130]OKJ18456.1 hypothetical protein AMK23_35570 [Streptomyces sp. CB02130]